MQGIKLGIIAILLLSFTLSNEVRQQSPSNIERVQTYWEWCQCGQGLQNITIWSQKSSEDNYTISIQTVKWIQFSSSVKKISWHCSQSMNAKSLQINLSKNQWLSILLYKDILQGRNKKCNISTGRISYNIWNETSYISSIPFTTHTEGYACFKVPTLLKTQKGTLIAFSEARSPGCDDFDRTELVYKRSYNNGKTWSSLKKLIENTLDAKGLCGHELVIGNISPVQLKNTSKYPSRIIAPYTRNNFKIWITYSDDDGLTWKQTRQIPNVTYTDQAPDCNRNMSYFGFNVDELKLKNTPAFIKFFRFLCTLKNPFNDPNWTSKLKAPWQFIAIGPSKSLQLKNGRIIVPGYRSPIRGLSEVPGALPISQLYSGFAVGFVLISDDFGDTWRIGKDWPIGQGTVEHQIIQLQDGTLLSNSRSLSVGSPQFRLQAQSFTQGQTFTPTEYIDIPQPIGGCQGSTVYGSDGSVFLIAPNPTKKGKNIAQYLTDSLGCKVDLNGRQKLSLWISHDNGKSYKLNKIIDSGLSAQTSLIFDKKRLFLLYEQADPLPKSIQGKFQSELLDNLRVLLQSRHVFREVIYDQTKSHDYRQYNEPSERY